MNCVKTAVWAPAVYCTKAAAHEAFVPETLMRVGAPAATAIPGTKSARSSGASGCDISFKKHYHRKKSYWRLWRV